MTLVQMYAPIYSETSVIASANLCWLSRKVCFWHVSQSQRASAVILCKQQSVTMNTIFYVLLVTTTLFLQWSKSFSIDS